MVNRSIWLILLILIIILSPIAFGLFGVGSGYITGDNLLPGSKFNHTINIGLGQHNEGVLKINFDEKSGYLKEWITAEGVTVTKEGYSMDVPSDKSDFKVVFNVKIPSDVAIGKYTGNINLIFAESSTPSSEGASVTINEGAVIPITLEVGNVKEIKLSILSLDILNTESKKQMGIVMKILNEGNTKSTTTYKLKAYVSSMLEKDNTLFTSDMESMVTVPEFGSTEATFVSSSPLNIAEGEYFVKVDVYEGEKFIKTFEKVIQVTKPTNEKAIINFEEFSVPTQVEKVGQFKISGVLANNGFSPAKVKLVVEISLDGTNSIISVLNSEEVYVLPGYKQTISLYYQPENLGKLRLKAYPIVDGAESLGKEAIVEVVQSLETKEVGAQAPLALSPSTAFLAGVATLLVAIIVVLIAIVVAMKRKNNAEKPKKRK